MPADVHVQESDLQFATSVVRRLVDHLDAIAAPQVTISYPDGIRGEFRDWMLVHCFRKDHALYDDIKALYSLAAIERRANNATD